MRPVRRLLIALFLLVPSTVTTAHASTPALVFDIGKTTAVSGPIDNGGLSLGAGAMWRIEETPWALPLRFGVMGYWDDMGTLIGPLVTPSGQYLGLAADRHQSAFGGAFRLDWTPARTYHRIESYATGTWGYYRVEDDLRGQALSGVSAPGFSLGLGGAVPLASGHRLGLVVRYHRLFDHVTGRYVSGALEWGWRRGS